MIKNFLNSPTKKRLVENFLSLSALQAVNYLLPLITLPYLVRILGPEKFGLIAFAQSFIQYFNILTDYGFNLSATKEISIHRDNKEKVSEIFSSVMIIKFGLMIISFLILSFLVFTIPKFRNNWLVYFFTFGMVLGNVLFPIWFFQGMERMKYITILNMVAKLIFTVSIFVFVHQVSDYIFVPLINSLGFLLAGLIALMIVFKDFRIGFKMPSIYDLKNQLKEGWYVFITSIQSIVLSSSSVFVLGIFEKGSIVGYYAAVEKLLKAFVSMFAPLTQALFPVSSFKLARNKSEGKRFIFKISLIIMPFVIVVVILLVVFAKQLLILIFTEDYGHYAIILQVLSVWLFLAVLNNFIGVQYLLGVGYSSYYFKSMSFAGIIALLIYFTLTPNFSFYGVLLGMICGELSLTLTMLYYIKRYKL